MSEKKERRPAPADETTVLTLPEAQPEPAAPNVATIPGLKTSLLCDSATGRAKMFNAMGPGESKLEGGKPLRLRIVDYVIYSDAVQDEETGEVSDVTRTVLIMDNGEHFRTTASHFPGRVAALCSLYSRADWQRGLPVVIEAKMGARGRVYHDIKLDTTALPA